jgi:hypothetical protein
MAGKGRHPILGVWSPDPVLSVIAPIGLAVAAGTALIVDLGNPTQQSGRTLADLHRDGPSLSELSPGRSGVAFLPGGTLEGVAAMELIEQLAVHWPAVVVRAPAADPALAMVPVVPLFPGRFTPFSLPSHGVWQPVGAGREPPGPGPVLPRLRVGAVRQMLSGRLPRRSRWVAAWRPVWEMPWA